VWEGWVFGGGGVDAGGWVEMGVWGGGGGGVGGRINGVR